MGDQLHDSRRQGEAATDGLRPVTIGQGYTGDDFYCDVAIPNVAELDVVADTDEVLAYHHTKPFWATHIVVVPKRHIASLTTITAADRETVEALFEVVQRVARDVEEREGAAGVLTNLGRYQDSKHLHVHVHSGPQTRTVSGGTSVTSRDVTA